MEYRRNHYFLNGTKQLIKKGPLDLSKNQDTLPPPQQEEGEWETLVMLPQDADDTSAK